jgi:hypothetical protein
MAFYDISVDPQGMMSGCSCLYFLRLERGCKYLLVLARRHPPEALGLPDLNIFRLPSVADSLPSDGDSKGARKGGVNRRLLTAGYLPLWRYTGAADSGVGMVKLFSAALEHAMTLGPTPDAHQNAKRVRQEPPVKRIKLNGVLCPVFNGSHYHMHSLWPIN